jgi:hypothetical protein
MPNPVEDGGADQLFESLDGQVGGQHRRQPMLVSVVEQRVKEVVLVAALMTASGVVKDEKSRSSGSLKNIGLIFVKPSS